MCELLISARSMTSGDFYNNCKLPKLGDVIFIAPDNHAWGDAERTNPAWRILCSPGTAVSTLSMLISAETNTVPPPAPPSKTLQYRGFSIDMVPLKVSPALLAYWNDDTRAQPRYVVPNATSAIQAAINKRTVIADPAIIGDPPNVIG